MADYDGYSEQDTVDTLILPYLSKSYGFPKPDSLDYQAQHTVPKALGGTGRYDGLYLSGGYPYAVLEAKRYARDLTAEDDNQGIQYATSEFFDKPVPFVVISNGREHRFFKITGGIDPATGHAAYARIPATEWSEIRSEEPGEVKQLLTEKQLLYTLRKFKQDTYNDIAAIFIDPATNKIDPARNATLGASLKLIVQQRQTFVGDTTSKSASKDQKEQQALKQAIDGIALHFTIKILFIKLIEDLSRGADSPRVIHTLFPQAHYDQVGGLFGYKVLNALDQADTKSAIRLYSKASKYYRDIAQKIARVTWQDIFRYGFNVHMGRYGQLFKAKDYDKFLPSDETLSDIRARLIEIDVRTAVIYGSPTKLERSDEPAARSANIYQFYDLWRLHPVTHADELSAAYAAILSDLSATKPFPFDAKLAKRYTVRQGLLEKYGPKPIFEGKPTLYDFMANETPAATELHFTRNDGANVKIKAEPIRGRMVVKLHKIADAKIGLQSGDNPRFFRTAPGVKGGAAKGGYKDVPMAQVVDGIRIGTMSREEKANGFQVDDPSSDKFYVPLDKAGATDIEGGLLPLFWRPVEFYVDWSQTSVAAMKALHGKGGVFRNPQHYFQRGISFSNTGIYSPTFRLGHGAVFDQKGSNVFCDVMDERVLLGILCSTVIRYFAKAFINHGVDAQLDELPIVIPTDDEARSIIAIVDDVILEQKKANDAGAIFDYRSHLAELDLVVNEIYGLDDAEKEELETWYHRHYPKLTGIADG